MMHKGWMALPDGPNLMNIYTTAPVYTNPLDAIRIEEGATAIWPVSVTDGRIAIDNGNGWGWKVGIHNINGGVRNVYGVIPLREPLIRYLLYIMGFWQNGPWAAEEYGLFYHMPKDGRYLLGLMLDMYHTAMLRGVEPDLSQQQHYRTVAWELYKQVMDERDRPSQSDHARLTRIYAAMWEASGGNHNEGLVTTVCRTTLDMMGIVDLAQRTVSVPRSRGPTTLVLQKQPNAMDKLWLHYGQILAQTLIYTQGLTNP